MMTLQLKIYRILNPYILNLIRPSKVFQIKVLEGTNPKSFNNQINLINNNTTILIIKTDPKQLKMCQTIEKIAKITQKNIIQSTPKNCFKSAF